MTISIPMIHAIIESNMRSVAFTGSSIPNLSLGIATGMYMVLTTSTVVNTIDNGTSGIGTGFVTSIPTSKLLNYEIIQPILSSSGFIGPSVPQLCSAISSSLFSILMSASVQTTNPTVAPGTAIASFSIDRASSFSIMETAFSSVGIKGPNSVNLIKAMSGSLCSVLSISSTIVPIVGQSTGAPSTGIGTGKII